MKIKKYNLLKDFNLEKVEELNSILSDKLEEIKNSLVLILEENNKNYLIFVSPEKEELRLNGLSEENIEKFLQQFLKLNNLEKEKIVDEIINSLNLSNFSQEELIEFLKGKYKSTLLNALVNTLFIKKLGIENGKLKDLFWFSVDSAGKKILREKFNLVKIKLAAFVIKNFKGEISELFKNFSKEIANNIFIYPFIDEFYEKSFKKEIPKLEGLNLWIYHQNLYKKIQEFIINYLINIGVDESIAKSVSSFIVKDKIKIYSYFVQKLLLKCDEDKVIFRKYLSFFQGQNLIVNGKKIQIPLFTLGQEKKGSFKLFDYIEKVIKKKKELSASIKYLNKQILELKKKKESLQKELKIVVSLLSSVNKAIKVNGHNLRIVNSYLRKKEFPEIRSKNSGKVAGLLDYISKYVNINQYIQIYNKKRQDLVGKLTDLSNQKRTLTSEKAKISYELKEINIEELNLKLDSLENEYKLNDNEYKKIYSSLLKAFMEQPKVLS